MVDIKLWNESGKRKDGRAPDEFRAIEIEKGIAKTAEGSASVKIGETHVVAGVKMELAEPFKDTPNEGILKVNFQLTPLASPEFGREPPKEEEVELARVIDRAIRESGAIELEKLCLEPGVKVWGVFIDILALNHQGNLLDAAALASTAALIDTRIPKLENEKIIRGEFVGPLPLVFKPISVTVCKADGNFLLDPSYEEEEVLDTKISFGIRDDDKVCAIQKYGSGIFGFEELEKAIDLAIEKSRELRRLL